MRSPSASRGSRALQAADAPKPQRVGLRAIAAAVNRHQITKPGVILGSLTGIMLLDYIDRFVLAAVLPAMLQDIGLSKTEGGMLGSAFMLGYLATSPIFGYLGDRFGRKAVLASGIFLWSAATIATGAMTSFGGLLACRVLVGIGEASYIAIAPTWIDDLYGPEKKHKRQAVFFMAIPVGTALGYILGGALGTAFGWSQAFLLAGLPGLLLAPALLALRSPARVERPPQSTYGRDVRGLIFGNPLYRWLVAGYTAFTFALGGFAFWAPTYLQDVLKLPPDKSNLWFGLSTVAAGIVGTWLGGHLIGRFIKKWQEGGGIRFCAAAAAMAAPLALWSWLSTSAAGFFTAAVACQLALFSITAPIFSVIMAVVPKHLRATALALNVMVIHLLGDLISPTLIGAVGDRAGLHMGMIFFPLGILATALCWWRAVSQAQKACR